MYNIIYNPNAFRANNTTEKIRKFTTALEKQSRVYNLFTTKKAGHATDIATQLYQHNERVFIVSGGDGTIFETLNGLSSDCTLGIIPSGTGNDIAVSLGITPQNAIKTIIADQIRAIDYGIINDDIKFLSLVSFGIVTDIINMLDQFKTHNRLNYFKALLKKALFYKTKNYKVIIDGQVSTHYADYLSVHNCKYAGGGMTLCAPALVDDGCLDLVVISYQGLVRRIFNLIAIATNQLHKQPNVTITKVKNLQIKSLEDSTCCIDGEILNINSLHIEVVTGDLQTYAVK